MKIMGRIIEAGTLENKGSATCGVVVKVPQAQRMEMMRIYAREVVVIPKADYDAREEGIEQLCEQIGQLRVALAAREAEEERLRDANLQRVAEGMSRWCKPQSPHLDAIADALEHAKRKNPKFADKLFSFKRLVDCSDYLYSFRRELEHEKRTNSTCATTILTCEALEAEEAFMQGDYKHTLEELAQCGAVIVRMMEAVHALVDEAAKAGKEAE